MADLKTTIANVFEPEIASEYFLEQTTEKSKLVQSGIAASTPETREAAAQAGRFIELPFWDDLADGTSTVGTDTDDEIVPTGS